MLPMKKSERERQLEGRQLAAVQKYQATPKGQKTRARANKRWNSSGRKRAHNRCVKYGVPLSFYDDLSWYPPDIREALNGSSQSQAAG